jgi:hypothetical protein
VFRTLQQKDIFQGMPDEELQIELTEMPIFAVQFVSWFVEDAQRTLDLITGGPMFALEKVEEAKSLLHDAREALKQAFGSYQDDPT